MFVIGKKELFYNKILGKMFKKLGAIPVDRENVKPSTIRIVIKKIKSGNNLLLYPEGTRNRTEEGILASLKNGATLFALLTSVPVIPMMLDKKPKIFRKNILMVGEPVCFEGYKPDKNNIEKASLILKEKMQKIKEDIEIYKSKK